MVPLSTWPAGRELAEGTGSSAADRRPFSAHTLPGSRRHPVHPDSLAGHTPLTTQSRVQALAPGAQVGRGPHLEYR